MIILILIAFISVSVILYHLRKNHIEKIKYNELSLYETQWHEKLLDSLKETMEEDLVFRENLKQLEYPIKKTPILIEKIQELTKSKIETNEDWSIFKQGFLKIYPYFFDSNFKAIKNLCKSEERLLALEKLGLDTFQIAKRLAISETSVAMIRYRLRKKLKITREAHNLNNLETFHGKNVTDLSST